MIYSLYLLNSVFSYWFFAYRNAVVEAFQEKYRVMIIAYIINIISTIIQITCLYIFANVYVYLVIPIVTQIITNFIKGIMIGKWYPFILEKQKGKLDKSEVSKIIKNVYSLLLYKISYVVLNSTDNLVLSTLSGIVIVGKYSNYLLLVGAVLTAVGTIFLSLTSSIGNLNVLGTKEHKLKIYNNLNFANFWLYGFCTVCLYNLLTPFITLWIGTDYLLGEPATIIICFNFLANGLRQTTRDFRTACGLFYEGRFMPLISSCFNIVLSVLFVKLLIPYNLEIVGVLLGTIISEFCVTWWYDAWLINKRVFKMAPKNYYLNYWKYMLIVCATAAFVRYLCMLFTIQNRLVELCFTIIICTIVTNSIFLLLFHRTKEFLYFYNLVRNVLNSKLRSRKMEEITLFTDKKQCCGCSACANVCPKNAIMMQEDEYGFLYPYINKELCIRCGLCVKRCAFQNTSNLNIPRNTYVAVTRNTDPTKSASGGVFASLAASVIKEGGVVFGCSLELIEGILTPLHKSVDKLSTLKDLLGSKYVQSDIGNAYEKAKIYLEKGTLVLFSGTPCQIDGLKSYLSKSYSNLLLVELVCHGVPNARMFQSYVSLLSQSLHGQINYFTFRDKKYGWKCCGSVNVIRGRKVKKVKIDSNVSSYYKLFLNSAIYRDSCYSCKYASQHRAGDITIGDYWGIEQEHPNLLTEYGGDIESKKGVSCLIVNTENGQRFFDKYKIGLDTFKSDYKKASNHNPQLVHPSIENNMRPEILSLFAQNGWKAVDQYFIKQNGFPYYKRKITNKIPTEIKSKIKQFSKKS
jgi:coenzyme F420-reducing hydrogenase beta subunit/O-antigen/teichoic acid export membrane protein